MRTFSHWTPRYVLDRLLNILYQKTHPAAPWLTRGANAELERLLRPDYIGVEFGSGRSTLWFARRIKSLRSVEHDRKWFDKVQLAIDQQHLRNVSLVLCPVERGTVSEAERYLASLDDMQPESIDFALVDGMFRDLCACRLVPLVTHGGILVIDNVNWFLPCQSRAPSSVPVDAQPATPIWSEFRELVKGWRCVWTSDGVTDTAIFIKGA